MSRVTVAARVITIGDVYMPEPHLPRYLFAQTEGTAYPILRAAIEPGAHSVVPEKAGRLWKGVDKIYQASTTLKEKPEFFMINDKEPHKRP